MTQLGASNGDTPSQKPRRVGGHYRGFLALLVALVVGVVIGGAVVAAFSGTDQIAAPTPSPSGPVSRSSTPGRTSTPSRRSPSSSANVQLSAACVRVVNDAQDAYSALGGLEKAAESLNATKLDDIIRQVQQLRRHLAADLPKCHAGIQLPSGSSSPTPSTTG